jgi:hypothetical protein
MGVLVIAALLCGYSLGHLKGVQEERGAWLATERSIPLPSVRSVDASGRMLQRSHALNPGTLTFYSNPRSGKVSYGGLHEMPLNVPDPREIQ